MATGSEWARSTRWLENIPGANVTDEIVGFVDNTEIDARGYFGRYSTDPTYDGEPIDPAMLYGEGWEAHHADANPEPVTRPDQLTEPRTFPEMRAGFFE
jgi:hypothetical protein